MTHPRFQVDQYRPGDVMLVIRLIEEHILPITLTSLGCPVLEIALRRDPVLGA